MKKQILTLILCGAAFCGQAQTITPNTINVCGGFINTGYVQLEWSVGESTAIESFIEPSITVLNGVLQPYTFRVTPSLVDNQWAANEIRIFPSPTTGRFEVNVMTPQQGLLQIQLIDNFGLVLASYNENYFGIGKIIRFDITRNAQASYF
jgi:hypothetical protein